MGLDSRVAEVKITKPEFTRDDSTVRAYLLAHSDAFRECDELRERASPDPPLCVSLILCTKRQLADAGFPSRDGRAQRETQSIGESMP